MQVQKYKEFLKKAQGKAGKSYIITFLHYYIKDFHICSLRNWKILVYILYYYIYYNIYNNILFTLSFFRMSKMLNVIM